MSENLKQSPHNGSSPANQERLAHHFEGNKLAQAGRVSEAIAQWELSLWDWFTKLWVNPIKQGSYGNQFLLKKKPAPLHLKSANK